MGLLDKVKGMVSGNKDKAKQGVDVSGRSSREGRARTQHDAKVDQAADAAKDQIDKLRLKSECPLSSRARLDVRGEPCGEAEAVDQAGLLVDADVVVRGVGDQLSHPVTLDPDRDRELTRPDIGQDRSGRRSGFPAPVGAPADGRSIQEW